MILAVTGITGHTGRFFLEELKKTCIFWNNSLPVPELYYDLSGEKSISLHDLFDKIGEGMGKRVRHFSCPMWLGSFGACCVKAITLGKVDFVEKVLRMSEDRDYDHDAAKRDFDYSPKPFDAGLQREIDEYFQLKGRT